MGTAITWLISFFLVVTTAFAAITVVVNNGANRTAAVSATDQILVEDLESSFKLVEVAHSGGRSIIELTLTNDGRRPLSNWEEWVITVKYDENGGGTEVFLVPTYTETLVDNTWTDFEFWLDYNADDPELIEPGILNPHEEMEMRIQLDPVLDNGTYFVVTLTSPTGVTESITLES